MLLHPRLYLSPPPYFKHDAFETNRREKDFVFVDIYDHNVILCMIPIGVIRTDAQFINKESVIRIAQKAPDFFG